MANYTHTRIKKTLYKQKVFKLLYEGFKGSIPLLAAQAGCCENTAYKDRTLWNQMSTAEQEAAYLKAAEALGVEPVKRRSPRVPETPECDISSMGGIHTPYNFIKRPRSRMWVSHY